MEYGAMGRREVPSHQDLIARVTGTYDSLTKRWESFAEKIGRQITDYIASVGKKGPNVQRDFGEHEAWFKKYDPETAKYTSIYHETTKQ